ncbi:MAG TPA: GNAT family N-acetyltransferase [bacterium]|nr:GNAT family N-acetyltransferase [bacterium]HPN45940.1 GNAT family N-acetyltransferase [bacterium]
MENITFIKAASAAAIAPWREMYLNSLPEAQELYLEMQIDKAACYIVQIAANPAGYFFMGPNAALLEYFIAPEYIDQVDHVFQEIVRAFAVQTALCKSFDHTLLSCCIAVQKSVKAIGIHFRERREKPLPPLNPAVHIRFAVPEDEHKIALMNEEVFEEDEQIGDYIKTQRILVFTLHDAILGFGIFSRVIPGRPEFDIGMLVDKPFRNQGYGSYIIHYLADYCRKNGWRGICGCAIDNIASRKSLEKAGFIACYRLLEITF